MTGTINGVPRPASELRRLGSWWWNRDPVQTPVSIVWFEKGLHQRSATSPRCTEVMETTQTKRPKFCWLYCVHVRHNFATLNNTYSMNTSTS